MKQLLADIRYSFRQLRHAPGFTVTAVLTLALGICATSTILNWISSTLLNPIPVAARTGNMVTVMLGDKSEHPAPPFSYADFVDVRANAKSFSGLLGYHDDYMSITGTDKPERIFGTLASSDYFEVLGVRPILGRSLLPTRANEQAGAPEAVLNFDLWQSRFGGDPNIVGKTIEINLHPLTIVGVAPRGFVGCKSGLRSDIWLPLGMDRQIWGSKRIEDRGRNWLNALGVLRPGVTARQAQNELSVIMQQVVDRYPTVHQGNNTVSLDPLWRSPFGANVYLSGTLPILLALAAALLLLACANVANLLLVRSIARRREFAIRLSLGAGRWTLMRQLIIEDLMIAGAGCAVALLASMWTVLSLPSFIPLKTLPLVFHTTIDRRAAVATILVSLCTVVISGIIPALRSASTAPGSILKDEALNASSGLRKSRLTSALVIMQVALSLLLLACAGLFVRSLRNAQRMNPGFDAGHVLVATFDLDPLGYNRDRGLEFYRQVVSRVKQLPGVESATLADFSPLSFTIHSEDVMPEGYVPHLHETIEVDRGIVGPGYLATLRTPLLAGRDFTEQDDAKAPSAAIVNQAFVDRYWPGQNAIGKRVHDGCCWYTVVGVSGNGKYRRLVYEPAPLILTSVLQRYQTPVILHVRTKGDPQAMAQALEHTVHSLNSNLPLYHVGTLQQDMLIGSVFERIAVAFAGSFGLLSLLLAAVGIYGVVAYTAGQRTHEIGIRMALGAGRGDIVREVLGQGLRLTAAGVAAGVIASALLTRFLRNMLFGIATTDWVTFATVSMLLCAVALVACLLPARRAASVNPMQALRTE